MNIQTCLDLSVRLDRADTWTTVKVPWRHWEQRSSGVFWEQPWWEPTIFPAVMGGATLGLLRLLLDLIEMVSRPSPLPRYRQLFASQGLVMLLLAILGGVVGWAFTGRTGDFIAGMTALSVLVTIADKLLDRPRDEPEAVLVDG